MEISMQEMRPLLKRIYKQPCTLFVETAFKALCYHDDIWLIQTPFLLKMKQCQKVKLSQLFFFRCIRFQDNSEQVKIKKKDILPSFLDI